ncbi:mechanosensitive ion channel family protein [Thalassomonas sp. M1454]|uniref:mechanosensitive ion channel family protein n=1 Tax=Thalassomonas sp. M1454 TaxID=2594477 RepID=UPI00117F1623|nr:mechanosensitive ion channel family protein [Thalassomonas sp. M1454]TRX55126.1 mechanosensitive ion channel family protein [Thalassomonas sp. M1454]
METWKTELKHYLSYIGDNPVLHAAIILVASWIFAWILDKVVIAYVKSMTAKTDAVLDDQLVELLHKPLFYSILVIGISVATSVISLPEQVSNIMFPVLYTMLLVLWTLFILRITKIVLRRVAENEKHFHVLHQQTLPLFENLALILILALSVYYIFSSWDIDMSAWLASAGIVGIAVGFAAKDTLANLFSGVFIMADAPYKIKDYIVLESGERGEVTNIGLRSTRILTRDNIEVTVPNSVMGNTKVINESGGPSTKYRIRAKIGAAYGSDIDLIEQILMEVAKEDDDICNFPLPVVRFRMFGASSLDFELMGWISEPALRGRIIHQLNSAIYKKFAEHNIEIPFAKQDVYIKEFPGHSLVANEPTSTADDVTDTKQTTDKKA